jgi:protein O-GlcNAc transferase
MENVAEEQRLEAALEHFANGRLRDTEMLCRQILTAQPHNDQALHLMGILANRAGRHDIAADLMRRAIAINPQMAAYHSNLGVVLTACRQFAEAERACREAVTLNPTLAEAHYNLGNALAGGGDNDAAVTCYRQTLALNFDYPQAHNNLGNALAALGQFDAAVEAYRDALSLRPAYAHARSNLANALQNAGRVDEALVEHRQAVVDAPADAGIRSNSILALYYRAEADVQDILEESQRWDQAHGARNAGVSAPHANDRSPERMLRVGFVSADLRTHPVAFFLLPILEAHDRRRLHMSCYPTTRTTDATTERLRAASDAWTSLAGMSDDAAAQRIRDDGIDILFDLSLHTSGNRLPVFARKPAPIQASYLGFMGTTGLSSMDYRVTDALIDPSGEDIRTGTEAPLRLPCGAWCYSPWPASPPVSPLPALGAGHITFASFNKMPKMTSHVFYLWARILQQVPQSRLLLKSIAFRSAETVERVRRYFGDAGIDAGRLDLAADHAPPQHLDAYAQVDIALDTFPFQGLTTTCEALWMGVPVVSLAGEAYFSRVGASVLSNAGYPELAAASYDEYVLRAVELASDLPALAAMRAEMRERLLRSPLMDATRFAQGFEAALRDAWRSWCRTTPAAT